MNNKAKQKREFQPTGRELTEYFRTKRLHLLTLSNLPICSHSGLAGSHREELERIYLREILPCRFEVGRGMVYGQFHRSREADIVIWDAQNYPSLPMLDHSFFFADSVKLVLESKTTYSAKEMADVLEKCRRVRDIVPPPGQNLDDLLEMMLLDIRCLKAGTTHGGMMIAKPHVGTAAMFLKGGNLNSVIRQAKKHVGELDDLWPDIFLLLDTGITVRKLADAVLFYDAGEDCLLAFTSLLSDSLRDRVVSVEPPHYLLSYAMEFGLEPSEVIGFRPTRMVPGREPLSGKRLHFKDSENSD